jgi:hypothetical protein
MIREHVHNSAWWGQPVAMVEDAAFFALAPDAQQTALKPFVWAEFKSPLSAAPPLPKLAASGFILVDAQLGFRLRLDAVPDSPSLAGLDCQFADQTFFEIGLAETRSFEHERFLQIPGATPERLAQRYVRWSHQLVREHPEWCVCVKDQGQVQGWFLATATERGLYLALAMLNRSAQVSGLHLYQKAIRAYAARGAHLGFASFSVRNTAVLNIYSQLGARFTPSEGVWLWLPGKDRFQNPI